MKQYFSAVKGFTEPEGVTEVAPGGGKPNTSIAGKIKNLFKRSSSDPFCTHQGDRWTGPVFIPVLHLRGRNVTARPACRLASLTLNPQPADAVVAYRNFQPVEDE